MTNEDALRTENFLLKHEIKILKDRYSYLRNSLRVIELNISKHSNIKKLSGQFVVFNKTDGKYCDPIIVSADSYEEALCPEDESYQRIFCQPLFDESEFKDI